MTPRPVREEQAWQEIGHTEYAPGVQRTLIIGFLVFITLVPLVQLLMPSAAYDALAGGSAEAEAEPATGTPITATIAAISAPPDTAGVYNDFLMQLHLTDIQGADRSEALVVVYGMRERVVQPIAAARPGSPIALHLQDWDSVAGSVAGINGSQLTDERFLTETPTFGAAIKLEASGPAGGAAFFGAWAGIGADLPPEHRTGTGAGMSTAWAEGDGLLDSFLATNGHLSKRIKVYETGLDDAALPALILQSPVQGVMSALGVGNEKAYLGRDGWLFFHPGVQSLTGPGFLEPGQLHKRSRTSTDTVDPRPAIIAFHQQLAERGIQLVLMPTPVKPTIHPEQLSSRFTDFEGPLRNRSMDQFLAEMAAAGVTVYDPTSLLISRKAEGPQYLATDTHWNPPAMTAVAAELASTLELPAGKSPAWTLAEGSFTQFGDIATMLKLPDWQVTASQETVSVQAVQLADGSGWEPDPKADVLLLGDSFTNIFHLGAMGWGAHGGFAEHLAHQLGRPVDLLARNDAGAHASRQLLIDALAQNPHRLTGKKVVIWQFAERELAVGDWKLLDLPPQPDEPPPPAGLTVASVDDAQAGYAAAVAAAGDAPAVVGKKDWVHLTAELKHLASGPFWGEHADPAKGDPLATLVDFHTKLEELGIDLILVPVPPRAVVYADTVFDQVPTNDNGAPVRLDTVQQQFYAALIEAGVTVVDPTDAFLAARADDATAGTVCCEQDTHWSPRGLQIAAGMVLETIGEPDWLLEAEEAEFFVQDPEELTYTGDLVGRVPGFEGSSKATIMRVTDDEAGTTPLTFKDDSPVLVLADSHGLVFSTGDDMHASGAGFAESLSAELGVVVDRMARRGSGDSVRTDVARRFLGNPSSADNKRVLVYTFAARTFTTGRGWKPVPLKR